MSQGRVLSKRDEVELADEIEGIFLEFWCMEIPFKEAKRQLRKAVNSFESYDDVEYRD
ncbi:hypothetical protein ES702_07857 [subsurface metagenome]